MHHLVHLVSLELTNVNFKCPLYSKIVDTIKIKACPIQKGIPIRPTKTHKSDVPKIAFAPYRI